MYSNLHLYVRATTFIASMCTALLCNKYGCFEGWAQTSAELFDLQRFTESVRCVKKKTLQTGAMKSLCIPPYSSGGLPEVQLVLSFVGWCLFLCWLNPIIAQKDRKVVYHCHVLVGIYFPIFLGVPITCHSPGAIKPTFFLLKSSISIGFSIINHPAIGVSPFVETFM